MNKLYKETGINSKDPWEEYDFIIMYISKQNRIIYISYDGSEWKGPFAGDIGSGKGNFDIHSENEISFNILDITAKQKLIIKLFDKEVNKVIKKWQ